MKLTLSKRSSESSVTASDYMTEKQFKQYQKNLWGETTKKPSAEKKQLEKDHKANYKKLVNYVKALDSKLQLECFPAYEGKPASRVYFITFDLPDADYTEDFIDAPQNDDLKAAEFFKLVGKRATMFKKIPSEVIDNAVRVKYTLYQVSDYEGNILGSLPSMTVYLKPEFVGSL